MKQKGYTIHRPIGYRITMVGSFCISVIFNYLVNIYWSFKVKHSVKNAIGVLAAHCFTIFVVRMSLMWIFVDIMSIPDTIAYIPTLLISMVTFF